MRENSTILKRLATLAGHWSNIGKGLDRAMVGTAYMIGKLMSPHQLCMEITF